jgi:hypothetical protein
LEGFGWGPLGGGVVFPNDVSAWGEKTFEALNDFPLGEFGPGLVVGRVEKDEVEQASSLGEPIFYGGGKDRKGVVERG